MNAAIPVGRPVRPGLKPERRPVDPVRAVQEIDAAAATPVVSVVFQRLFQHQVELVELELVSIVRRKCSVVAGRGIVGIASDSHVQPTVDVDAGGANFANHSAWFVLLFLLLAVLLTTVGGGFGWSL